MSTETEVAPAPVATFPWRVRNDDVAVQPRDAATVTKGGIVLAGSGDLPMIGIVLAVGRDVDDVPVASTVAFGKYSGHEMQVKFRGKSVVILNQKAVKMVLEGVEE